MIVRLAAVSLLAAVVAGAAGAAAGDPQRRLTRADEERATAAVLKGRDLGTGWRVTLSSAAGDRLVCPGVTGTSSDLVVTGDAGSTGVRRTDGTLVSSSVEVYARAEHVSRDWRRTVRPGLASCLGRLLRTSLGTGTVLSARTIPFPRLTSMTAAYRVAIRVSGQGRTATGFFDFVFVGRGRSELSLLVVSAQRAPALSWEASLARLVASRMR